MSMSNAESKGTPYALSNIFCTIPWHNWTYYHNPKGKWPDTSKNQVFREQIRTHKVTLKELINCRKLREWNELSASDEERRLPYQRLPRKACSCSKASKSALKLPAPNPSKLFR
ncbi:hypothetical protein H113_01528 [Trichophyton rubrum MR1459]|uniref:Uncharacterized protein n=1 Tax=Trichophyton rubrum (strain ATCC MYA-4607 / CBS 118892) TaxID=559305 RepID=A0A080WP24_TRIRC|nr:uncharacterized protein TERG_12522 [Trichophyton rubrum CBS 118892]EZF98675.1 hypothetical protein H113_01528 [Trichophyton rubrum MR1459]EZG09749.1 hypothetical protein H106_01290 [Trichophyton rubrum CBS 735.88]KFL62612.1 hypothetical protein TERG_12522 [Trichophyton rubrum CBS 118892]